MSKLEPGDPIDPNYCPECEGNWSDSSPHRMRDGAIFACSQCDYIVVGVQRRDAWHVTDGRE